MAGKQYVKGKSYEYKLMKILWSLGYFVIRVPGSGAGYKKFIVPDLIAIKNNKAVGVEVKMRGDDRYIYIPKYKFERLKWIENKYGIKMFLCVWYKMVGEFKCLEFFNYTYASNEYVVFTREDILKKGKRPELLF